MDIGCGSQIFNYFSSYAQSLANIVEEIPKIYLVRIRPQQVTQQPLVGHVCRSHYPPNLFHRLEVWAQTTVAAEDFLVNNCGHRQAVKAISEGLPQFDVIPPFA